uniref:centromere protein V-like n=1 Tax=Styela clava TaxID=7725 RepID=UPI001939AFF8|nr:centromere protein V-like [Styela clava]
MASKKRVKHHGSCHCGAVKFEVYASEELYVYDCNCSICVKKHNIHFIVREKDFELIQGSDALTTYTFNTGVAKHMFCKMCGVQSFYRPRSNPDGYGVNPNSLDHSTVKSITIEKYDGQNWEASFDEQLEKPVPIQSWSK